MASDRARQSGFSLLELIIVLMVMISLLVIAWPNLQRPLRRTTLHEAAQMLRSAIDDCRYQAITTGESLFIELRQGESLLRAGSFNGFTDIAGALAPTNGPAQPPVLSEQSSNGQRPASVRATIKTWTLPLSVVISELRWTLAAPVEENGKESVGDSNTMAEVQSDSMIDVDHGALRQTWWLPLVATGHGRDAAIVLLDTSVNEEITVTFVSATGALEIVR